MNLHFLKTFPVAPGEGRGQAAGPTGAPGVRGCAWAPSPPVECHPVPAEHVQWGPFRLPLDVADGTVYTRNGHESEVKLEVRRTWLGSYSSNTLNATDDKHMFMNNTFLKLFRERPGRTANR